MLFYKRTGLNDYLEFIKQHSRKGIVNIYQHVTNKNSFLDLPDNMAPDRNYWTFVMTVRF